MTYGENGQISKSKVKRNRYISNYFKKKKHVVIFITLLLKVSYRPGLI